MEKNSGKTSGRKCKGAKGGIFCQADSKKSSQRNKGQIERPSEQKGADQRNVFKTTSALLDRGCAGLQRAAKKGLSIGQEEEGLMKKIGGEGRTGISRSESDRIIISQHFRLLYRAFTVNEKEQRGTLDQNDRRREREKVGTLEQTAVETRKTGNGQGTVWGKKKPKGWTFDQKDLYARVLGKNLQESGLEKGSTRRVKKERGNNDHQSTKEP